MGNRSLHFAKVARNDEFYTRYEDIDREIGKFLEYDRDLFKGKSVLCPCDDPDKSMFARYFTMNFKRNGCCHHRRKGRILDSKAVPYRCRRHASNRSFRCSNGKVLDIDVNTIDSLSDFSVCHWRRLDGDGDFMSAEVGKFKGSADFIVTNPPFSLLVDFIPWCMGNGRRFLVIGNMNVMTYRTVFPMVMDGKLWIDSGMKARYDVPDGGERDVDSCWITNISRGEIHVPLELKPMDWNVRNGKHKGLSGKGYRKYDNYDALEVPFVDSIPSDYEGVMGVPVSFLNVHCPSQSRIVGATESEGVGFSHGLWDGSSNTRQPLIDGKRVYKRIFIQRV